MDEVVIAVDLQIYASKAEHIIWSVVEGLRQKGLRITAVDFSHPLMLSSGERIENILQNKAVLRLGQNRSNTSDLEPEVTQSFLDFFAHKVVPDRVEDPTDMMFPK